MRIRDGRCLCTLGTDLPPRWSCPRCSCCGGYNRDDLRCVKCQEQARAGALRLSKRANTKKASGSLRRPSRKELAKLWAPPAPELHNRGIAIDPVEYLKGTAPKEGRSGAGFR